MFTKDVATPEAQTEGVSITALILFTVVVLVGVADLTVDDASATVVVVVVGLVPDERVAAAVNSGAAWASARCTRCAPTAPRARGLVQVQDDDDQVADVVLLQMVTGVVELVTTPAVAGVAAGEDHQHLATLTDRFCPALSSQ